MGQVDLQRVERKEDEEASPSLTQKGAPESNEVSGLRHALDERDKEIQLRDEFLTLAAHELNTPVTAVTLRLQTGLRQLDKLRSLDADPQQIVKLCSALYTDSLKQMGRLGSLIDSLIDLSRLQSGDLQLYWEQVRANSLIQDVLDRYAQQLMHAHCQLCIESDDSIVGRWDRHRLEKALSNLLCNAIRYAPGTLITIGVRRENANAVFYIRDQGQGIAKDVQEKIFALYEHGASDWGSRGMGVGLFLTKEIARAHGGSIKLESDVGKGALFEVSIPLSMDA